MRIWPFRGWRYGDGTAQLAEPGFGDVSGVVAPPYDQVDAALADRLRAASPHQIAHLTLPGPGGPAAARQALVGWLREGAWRQEKEPAIYLYEQSYRIGDETLTRHGVVALGEVSDYAAGGVRPHEQTHPGPREERRRLLEATGADAGLLFMLVPDPDGSFRRLTEPGPTAQPVAEAAGRGGRHRLWRIVEPATIAAVVRAMDARSVVIADGHHRYEAALAHSRSRPGVARKLMALFPAPGPGLTILANHRLVRGLPEISMDTLVSRSMAWFETTRVTDPLAERLEAGALVVVVDRAARRLQLRPGAATRLPWPPGASPAWRRLAVSVLHEGLLRPALGLTEAMVAEGRHLTYTADPREAVAAARSGRCQAAFLIPPTTTAELLGVVEEGERLPPKSTHFHPKLLDGLVFALLPGAEALEGPGGSRGTSA